MKGNIEEAVFFVGIFTLIILFWGSPDIHDSITKDVISCQEDTL